MADDQGQTLKPTKPAPWNDPAVRSIAFQALAILAVGYFFYVIFQNTMTNMEKRGISTGFGFLSEPSGFGILMSMVEYSEASSYGRTFLVGLLNTLLISVLGIFLATIIGFTVGVARLSPNWLLAKIATVYVETLRNIPLLLQMFFWYFAVLAALPSPRQSMGWGGAFFLNNRGFYFPRMVFEDGSLFVGLAVVAAIVAIVVTAKWAHKRQEKTGQQFHTVYASIGILIGLPALVYFAAGMPISLNYAVLTGFNFQGGMRIIPELMALLWAISFYTAAFIAEIVRAGILAVSHGQTEAAGALGLRAAPTLRLVVVPQALRIIIPPLTSQYLNLAKNSSLATAIGYPDLVAVFMGTTLNQTGQAVEIVGMTMAVYLTISLTISAFMNWYNKRKALIER
ncbi:MAG: amino acid ABC transporter permease [Rhodospirillales bacterium]|nr:amino acid ABC transporter permease [Rhodospirillales bacterium]